MLLVPFLDHGPFKDCSPVLWTNYLEFDWFVPKTGLQSFKGCTKRMRTSDISRTIYPSTG